MSMLKVQGLKKAFGIDELFNDVNFEISRGDKVGFVGPNGAGKTTLMRCLMGLTESDGGTISFDSQVINDIAPSKRNIGMVFQNYAVFPHMSVRKNVEFGLKNRKVSKEATKKRAI